MNQSPSHALIGFVQRHFFGKAAEIVLNLITKYKLEEALDPVCGFVSNAMAEKFKPDKFLGNILEEKVYSTVTHLHSLINQELIQEKQEPLIESCYLLGRALILDLRSAVKEFLPDYLDRICSQIKKVALVQAFEPSERIKRLGLEKLRELDKEEQGLSKPSINKPKTIRSNTTLGAGKLNIYLEECGRLMQEQYEIIPDQDDWKALFQIADQSGSKVKVFKRKRNQLVLLLYLLFDDENGYLMVTGGSGRNGLAPIIKRTFVDENGNILVSKPKDMLRKLKSKKDQYSDVWSDVEEIIQELWKLERQHLDDKITKNGRNEGFRPDRP